MEPTQSSAKTFAKFMLTSFATSAAVSAGMAAGVFAISLVTVKLDDRKAKKKLQSV